ncbi:hypothetical protein CJF42_09500 [Pseudoalteromonas sp. NBT06-2]|uniref:flagellar hook-length control protein FliK n=1 Tax=Pseudoalteromonas sp. NBT06-2 TaxID=2025950 RepID=UPI000BA798A1|nr:flagellar hook-length control protein FliK [Pseudoalteromonas sp. NBT06-2]PAJ74665.1 hypothetical protein CJF42_09500 [Pseudoalteromonas sp. NBT06-2]
MVNIDQLIPSSNNTLLKQSSINEKSNDKDGEGLFSSMFSSQINDMEDPATLSLFAAEVRNINNKKSGNKLPSFSDIDTSNLDIVIEGDKKNQNVDTLMSDELLNKSILLDGKSENIEKMNNSDDSLLSQIQASNKMSLMVSDETLSDGFEFKNIKLNSDQAIDESNQNENSKDISSIIVKTDNNISGEQAEKLGKAEIAQLNSLKSEIEVSHKVIRNATELPQVKLNTSVVNQLKQVLPELSTEQKSQLKLSLESALSELGKRKMTTDIVNEIEKLNSILLQVDELIAKDETKADNTVRIETLNINIKKQENELVNEVPLGLETVIKAMDTSITEQDETIIQKETTSPSPKKPEQNLALGKNNNNDNFKRAVISENRDLIIEDEILENIKSNVEITKETINSGKNTESLVATPITKIQVNTTFNDIIRQLEPQSSTGLESDPVTDFTNSIAVTQTSTSLNAKLESDKLLQQPINIARSDAAKLLNERVTFMLSQHNPQADIRLDPPELGSMIIRVRTDAEQAQINFSVQNQQAKELLEESLPKLREMLAEQGIDLGESNIEQQQGKDEQESLNSNQNASQSNSIENDEVLATVKVAGNKLGGVDFYA